MDMMEGAEAFLLFVKSSVQIKTSLWQVQAQCILHGKQNKSIRETEKKRRVVLFVVLNIKPAGTGFMATWGQCKQAANTICKR